MISEAAKKAAEDYIADNRVYNIDDNGNQHELICDPQPEDLTPFIQSAIDAELEQAAMVCESVALEREKQLENAKTPYTAQTRNAQAHECRKLADHIRSLKRGSAK